MPTTPKPKKTKGKIGPLPAWGWAAVGAGVYGVYYIYRRHNANLAAAGATTVPLGVGTATNPGTGMPGAITTATPNALPTVADLREKFLAQATAANGGGLSATQALDAWNKFIGGQALTGRPAQVTKNIIGNLSAGGFIPPGISTVINVVAPQPGATVTHTPTALPSAYVPVNPAPVATSTSPAVSTNKPAATRSAAPTKMINALPPARPTKVGGTQLQTVVPVGNIGVGLTRTGNTIVRAINNAPGFLGLGVPQRIPTRTQGTGRVQIQQPAKTNRRGAQGAYGLAAPQAGPAPQGSGALNVDLNPFHYLGFL
jgi:hypothetical protein